MKTRISRVILLTVMALACALVTVSCASLPEGGEGVSWTIHYFRPDGNYSGWDIWIWPAQPNDNGAGYAFGSPDADGFVTTTAYLPEDVGEIGLIVRQGGDSWTSKDVADDRFSSAREIWLISGDPVVHEKKPAVRR
jgi:pullulanase